jgi:ABC-type transporter Mla subunit MlaD
MKGRNEFLVGLVLLLSVSAVVAGALWLSEADIGRREALHVARFRTVGGLTPGAPVTYRGVRVGRVEGISSSRRISGSIRGLTCRPNRR